MHSISGSKQIAKNTILLYVRTLFSQLLALYTARKILEILGVVDFGVYNIVGGVIGILAFINNSMTTATQRYLTFVLGKEDKSEYCIVFSMACYIHLLLAILVFIAAEFVGVWFVNNYLNIPSERMIAANWVFQISVLMTFISIVQTPYMASLTAHERMDVYAYVGMSESVLKLLIVFCLIWVSGDKLVIYGFLLLTIQILSAIAYRCFCIRNFRECRILKIWDKKLFCSLLGFTGWNVFGSVAWILKDQGNNILMNIFGGPAINAARGIAYQISNAVQNLVNGFTTAINPQLTKNYASNNDRDLQGLFISGSKIAYFLLMCIALPVLIETPYILQLWLVKVPSFAAIFTRIILLEALFSTLTNPMITVLLATGNIKWYQIVVGCVMLLNVPLSYVLLRMGASITIPLIVSLVITFVSIILRFMFCKYQLSFSTKDYLFKVVSPITIVSLVSAITPLAIYLLMDETFIRFLAVTVTGIISALISIYFIGLSKRERIFVAVFIQEQIRKIRK